MTAQRAFVRVLIAGVSLAGLSACANLDSFSMGDLPVAADSPVAEAAREAARNPGPWPTFADVPKAPAEPFKPEVYSQMDADLGAQVMAMRQASDAFQPVSQAAMAQFVANAKQAVSGVSLPPETSAADIESFARAMRARATPPPPPS